MDMSCKSGQWLVSTRASERVPEELDEADSLLSSRQRFAGELKWLMMGRIE